MLFSLAQNLQSSQNLPWGEEGEDNRKPVATYRSFIWFNQLKDFGEDGTCEIDLN